MGLLGNSDSEPTPEQEVEYKAVEVDSGSKGVFSLGRANLTDALNEMAKDGWRFVDTRQARGKTTHFIFEREIQDE